MIEKEPDWQHIVNDIGPGLYRYFCGVVTPSEASDLVQESLIRLVQKIHTPLVCTQGDVNAPPEFVILELKNLVLNSPKLDK